MVAVFISLALLLYWLFRTEVPAAYAPVVAANEERPGLLVRGLFVVALLTLFVLSATHTAPEVPLWAVPHRGTQVPLLLLACSAFLTTFLARQVTPHPSVAYAFVGALWGYGLYVDNRTYVSDWLQVGAYWAGATLAAAAFGAFFYYICWRLMRRCRWDLFKLYGVLKYVLLGAVVLLTIGFTVNNGPLFLWITSPALTPPWGVCVVMGLLPVTFLLLRRPLTRSLQRMIHWEFDVNVQTTLAVTLSAALILWICPVPLSVPSVIFAALIGAGCVQRKEMLEAGTYVRMLFTHAATPIVALFLSYNFCVLFTTPPLAQRMNLNTLLFLLFLLVGAAVLLAVHYHQKMSDLRKHVSRVQQEQAFESQKALSAVDIKTVLAENQNLHQRLERKRNQLVNVALNISEQKEFIDLLYRKVRAVDALNDGPEKNACLQEIQNLLLQRKSFSQEIDSFYAQAESLHKDFSLTLNDKFPHLTAQEKKLATLLRLGFSSKEIATLMNISAKSAEIGRYRLRKKLNLSHNDNLIQFIKSI